MELFEWMTSTTWGESLLTLLVSMVPVIELRGGVPFGTALGLAPLHALVNARALREGLLTSAGDYGRPWFGQLMAGPQMLAYLVQLNVWMERFHLTV